MKTQSACEKVIRRDIARTYPEHDFFKKKDGVGQEALFNVMKAYSIHDREVGYCQGSAFIVGLLLMQGWATSRPLCPGHFLCSKFRGQSIPQFYPNMYTVLYRVAGHLVDYSLLTEIWWFPPLLPRSSAHWSTR